MTVLHLLSFTRFTIVGQSDQACGNQSTTSLVGRYSTTSSVENITKPYEQENIPQQAWWKTFHNNHGGKQDIWDYTSVNASLINLYIIFLVILFLTKYSNLLVSIQECQILVVISIKIVVSLLASNIGQLPIHTKSATLTRHIDKSVPKILVGKTFQQGLQWKVSHKPSRTSLQQ